LIAGAADTHCAAAQSLSKVSLKENQMNNDIFEGKWKQLKGSIQTNWGKITDSDLDRIEGSRERLVGMVQERYGKDKEQARKEVDEYLDSL